MEEKKQEAMENAEETVDAAETEETVEGEVETEEATQDNQEEAEAAEEEKPIAFCVSIPARSDIIVIVPSIILLEQICL